MPGLSGRYWEAAYTSRRTRLLLGKIYSLLGRRHEARRMLKSCFDEYAASGAK